MTFSKGQSGNPGGKRKVSDEFRAKCREYTKDALEAMKTFLNGSEPEYKFRAIQFLIEHGHGKAPQGVEVQGDISIKVNLIKSK